ncbi:hypothetical protein K435DRAFT_781310 [Dendrothele bispora CBS 962.96]|uniref:Uncharacterized protein n=1 Tax=Dendrothele bispora (strain CBS 962.96) TaxID=1314807 RepID=A0A4S8LMU9_DENBC|nr:hypothetical protein K435DRAFT_781310 [Dendrothele bispora CBS 962.96]
MNEYSTEVGPGENVEDEPNQVHKELEKKLDHCMECRNRRELWEKRTTTGQRKSSRH